MRDFSRGVAHARVKAERKSPCLTKQPHERRPDEFHRSERRRRARRRSGAYRRPDGRRTKSIFSIERCHGRQETEKPAAAAFTNDAVGGFSLGRRTVSTNPTKALRS